MKQIFVIIEGEYSAWNIVGYTDSEDEAMQICAQHNDNCGYDDWYYEDAGRVESPKQHIELRYVHTIRFNRTRRGVSMLDYYTVDYYPERSPKAATDIKINEAPAWIVVSVPLKENNRERAEKIAQDAIYKYLYDKQEN